MKKILLVSDFIVPAWWIENYIIDVKSNLEKQWYQVKLFWFEWFWKNKNISKILKIVWLFLWIYNIYFAYKLNC
jgi:hypothetical protein